MWQDVLVNQANIYLARRILGPAFFIANDLRIRIKSFRMGPGV